MNDSRAWRGFTGLAAPVLAVACLGSLVWAQDAGQPAGSSTGQPARAVRLSYVDGQVKLSQGDQVLADQAVVNTPLVEGMQLTSAANGKAEIQFEDGSVARISPSSSLTLAALHGSGTGGDAELKLNSGLAYFEFQGGNEVGQMSVCFGDSVVTTSGFTVVRVTMDNPPGEVAVFSGNAHLESNNGSVALDLHGGESVALTADPNNYNLAESIEPNSWDAWNSDRDQVLTSEAAAQTGAPSNMGQSENPAWNDLDANGSWYNVPGQGYVWSPYDASDPGWDPYGNGNWMWTPGFGYIWASGYPWGYLPFQCGAWNFYNGFGWGWAPGMGGCMPWWGLGFYGGPNFGYVPPGYRVIARPLPPRHPIVGRPVPVLTVNRSQPLKHMALPPRNGTAPVTIAGNAVQPLHPLPMRQYNPPKVIIGTAHLGSTEPAQSAPVVNNVRPGYNRPLGLNPAPGQGQAQPNAAQRSHNSTFGNSFGRSNQGGSSAGQSSSNSHPSSGSAPSSGGHPSGGGGGAASGGGHPSGGGSFSGGGGGGGSHGGGGGGSSGGGGGGHH
jgi:hypothetical protein